jgi:hypothetical protein
MKAHAIAVLAIAALAGCSSSPSKPAPAVRVWQLSWSAPAEAEDGAAITDITGYRVEWGTAGAFDQHVELPPEQLAYRVTVARTANAAFRVVAVSSSRGESSASNVAVTPIR